MKSNSVLIVGCGDLGVRVGSLLVQRGWEVTGMRRNTAHLPSSFTPLTADYTQPQGFAQVEALKPDYVLTTLNPTDRSSDGYRRGFTRATEYLLTALGEHQPKLILMSSSTRVFAEAEGGWVDVDSPLTQSDPWAQAIIGAEQLLRDSGHNTAIVRFAGIYGIPGGRLLSRIQRGELCPPAPVSYTNRLHREDCAGFLAHLLTQASNGEKVPPLYIGCDDLPAPRFTVETWLAQAMGLPDANECCGLATSTAATQHNRAGHKRCSNRSLRESGYDLIFPTYKEGYAALLGAD